MHAFHPLRRSTTKEVGLIRELSSNPKAIFSRAQVFTSHAHFCLSRSRYHIREIIAVQLLVLIQVSFITLLAHQFTAWFLIHCIFSRQAKSTLTPKFHTLLCSNPARRIIAWPLHSYSREGELNWRFGMRIPSRHDV